MSPREDVYLLSDPWTAKQAKVVIDLAKIVAGKDAEMKEKYGV